LDELKQGFAMPEKTHSAADSEEAGLASIEQILDAERAVEAMLADAREEAARLVADAYDTAQSVERQTDTRIAKLARECARENERRVEGILAEAEEIEKKVVDAKSLRGAIRDIAEAFAARLTVSEP
jgi:vacuolar-type H+-ATPase subunit H